ncbi:hypothetical protein CBS101457_000989 [Exobasidium rhododendri]|nr:hypothetical protein CBS101457_000989 [Exobasidium rhododendri]
MPAISSKTLDVLRGPILSILRKSDLTSISAKKVRNALINTPADAMQGDVGSGVDGPRLLPRLGVDIEDKSHKKAIDELIRQCFDIVNEDTATKPANATQINGTPKLALPGMGGVPGSHSNTAPSSSAASSSAPLKKRARAEDDEVISEEEDADAETISKIAKSSKAKAPAKKKRTKSTDTGDKEKKPPNPNNPFNRPVILSTELSQICGGNEMPRYMITKQLWAYIKGKDLQNPSNKRKASMVEILCDSALRGLFGKAEVDSFEMAKLISPHVTKKVIDPANP